MLSCLSTLHCTIAIQCSFDTAASSGFSIKFWQQINYIINAYHSQLNILNLLWIYGVLRNKQEEVNSETRTKNKTWW
jgi:hypothetical protein